MFRQSIIDSLQSLFPGITWSGLQSLNPQAISEGIASAYGLQEQDVPAEMFQSLSPGLFESAQYQTYAPMMAAEGDTLLSNLKSTLGGIDVSKSYGGFAGTAASARKEKQARDVYGKGLGDMYSNIRGMQTEALTGIQSGIDQWRQSAEAIKGY